jgi:hypothetical protein
MRYPEPNEKLEFPLDTSRDPSLVLEVPLKDLDEFNKKMNAACLEALEKSEAESGS